MGGVVSYLLSYLTPASQPDTTPDATTGLTERDREIITETWGLIANKKVIKLSAMEFFIQFFTDYPYMLDFFPALKGKSISELRKSTHLRPHATSVFYALTSYVENVDDPENLVGLVKKISISHVGRGIGFKEFEDLKTSLLKFVTSKLGPKGTPEVESAWRKLLTAHNSVFQATAEELSDKK
uniref:Globin n=1 Tax=Arion vulgaris TaxID=1028688 RepID=A0A0B7A0X1_9EUPU